MKSNWMRVLLITHYLQDGGPAQHSEREFKPPQVKTAAYYQHCVTVERFFFTRLRFKLLDFPSEVFIASDECELCDLHART